MENYIKVDGLKTRYLEEGTGPAVVFLHGASLGSSADVYQDTLERLAKGGYRAIAFDQPGYVASHWLGAQPRPLGRLNAALGRRPNLVIHRAGERFA